MNLKEKLIPHNKHSSLLLHFIANLNEEMILSFHRVIEKTLGTLKYHEELAFIASSKEEFLSHIQEMDEADKQVVDFLREKGHECFKLNTLESITVGSGSYAILQSKAAEFGLIGDLQNVQT